MAKHALVIGINYEGCSAFTNHDFCVLNAININNFFVKSGYTCSDLLLEANADFNGIHKAIRSICKNLNKGDTFCLYFSGYGGVVKNNGYIIPYDQGAPVVVEGGRTAKGFPLKFIEEISRKPGVQRILILDWEKISGRKEGSAENAIAGLVHHVPADSPIGIFCSRRHHHRHNLSGFSHRERSNLSFTSTLLNIFKDRIKVGLEISFPSICKPVLKRLAEWDPPSEESFHSNIGENGVVIYPGKSAISDLAGKKRIKAEADELLEKLLEEHALWRKKHPAATDGYKLTLSKMEPIIDIYQKEGLGSINLARRNLSGACFIGTLPEGMVFSYSDLSKADISPASLMNIDFSKCNLISADFSFSNMSCCNFTDSDLADSNFSKVNMACCIFDRSTAHRANFEDSKLMGSSFRHASLTQINLSGAAAIDCDLTDANLTASMLVGADLSESALTGTRLYGTARTDWSVKDVKCQYVYWDREGKERFPPDNDFHEGEFYTQYRPYAEFSYTFKEGITPLDLMLATHIVEQINAAGMGFKIKIDNASIRGLSPTLNFIMETGDDKQEEASKLFKAEYEHRIALLEQKLQSSETLLAEQGRRTDLTEQQLSEMTALAKRTSFFNNSMPTNYQQFAEHLFTPLMTELFKDGGLISQYSANKSKNLSQLGPDDLADYRYIALFRTGSYADDLSKQKLDILHTELRKFMRNECLVVLDSELADTREDSYIKSLYSIFNPPAEIDAYIAVGTVFAEEKLFAAPVYREISWNSRDKNSFQVALSQTLRELRVMLTDATLDQFPRPPLPPGAQPLLFANGTLIASKLNEKRIVLRETNSVVCPDTGGNLSCHRETVSKAKKGDLVLPSTLKYLSYLLGVPEPELMFTRIVPNKQHVCAVRKILASEARKETRDWFGPFSDFFFEQIEMADDIPAQCMKFVYHHYKKLFEAKHKNGGKRSKKIIKPLALIDTEKTLALHVRLQQGQSR